MRTKIAHAALVVAIFAVGAVAGAVSYKVRHDVQRVPITAQQASQAATWAVNVGAWDKDPAYMTSLKVYRSDNSPTGFYAKAEGVELVASGGLKKSDVVDEVVP